MSLFGGIKIYTVHIRSGTAQAVEKPVFVKEGFAFWSFVFPLFWALYKRLWLPAIGIFLFSLLLLYAGKTHLLDHVSLMVLNLGFHVLVGYLSNDWLRNALARRGYILSDITASDNRLRAQQRYFERHFASA